MSTFHEAVEKLEALIAARRMKPQRPRRERQPHLQLINPLHAREACRPSSRPMRKRAATSIPQEAS